MYERIRATTLRLLRVPPDPVAPDDAAGRVRVFRAAPGYYRYSLLRWGIGQAGAVLGLLVWLFFIRWIPEWTGNLRTIVLAFETLAWIGFLLQLPVTYALLRLDYDLRWYIVSDRSLRIREGLTRIREQTMTFANIQNISIRQGPLQRWLGIADVEVHTAGGGSGGDPGEGAARKMHVGVFRGVAEAAAIRQTIGERVRLFRDAGLGDPDDGDPHASAAEDEDMLADPEIEALPTSAADDGIGAAAVAAQELLTEVRALRRSLPHLVDRR